MSEIPPIDTPTTESNLVDFASFPRKPKGIEPPTPPPPSHPFSVGDWVRYYGQNGLLSVAVVEYIKELPQELVGPGGTPIQLLTDKGVVNAGNVVEIRKVTK